MLEKIAYITPEIFIVCAALFMLMLGAFRADKKAVTFTILRLSLVALVIAAILENRFYDVTTEVVLNKLFILDGFAIFMKTLIFFAAFVVLSMAFFVARSWSGRVTFEFPVLVLLAVAGMMVMVSANDLMSLYMGLEMQSLALYVLASLRRDSEKSSEAGLKYFMLGALASGLLLYGCSLIYGFTGTTNFTALETITASADVSIGVLVGMILVIIGMCFKVSAAPFHMWTPDVYEGVPKIVTAFFATAPKVAALAVFIRFVEQPFGGAIEDWQQVLVVISVISMLVGSFAALRQKNIKRLLAYSSIGHVGFMLIGVVAASSSEGIAAVLIYLTIYVTMNLGAFACVIMMKRKSESLELISDLAGLAKYRPMMAAALSILMLSMAGIPPMAGFFGKLFIFKAAIANGFYILATIGVLSSVVAAFYYLKIIKVMYFDDVRGKSRIDTETDDGMKYVLLVTALFNLLFFIFPLPLLEAARIAATTLFL